MLVVIHDISYLQRQTTKNYHLLRIIKDKKKVKLYFSEYQSNIEFFIRFFLTTGRYNISNYLFFFLSVSSTSSVIKKLRGMNISRENSGIVFLLRETSMLLENYWTQNSRFIQKMQAWPCFKTKKYPRSLLIIDFDWHEHAYGN